ncbi:MAG: Mu-like prophage major head subunit gpT family protein [Rhodobacter sp.]|nr:Mu-like prophage major head subunit gpT family protein [Rhodobacter sp.]
MPPRPSSKRSRCRSSLASGSRDETYGWIGNLPAMREWIGQRVVNNLSAYGFTITNRKFELTVSVGREDIEDDRLGTFKPAFAEMGGMARRHPDELIFELLKNGFTSPCFDGQNFFDTDHPVIGEDGTQSPRLPIPTAARARPGSCWTSRAVRPIIWQERVKYEFQSLTDDSDEEVFFNDRYIYGVRARVNAGFGLWQLARGSKQTLNFANYASARADAGLPGGWWSRSGVKPSVLVVAPARKKRPQAAQLREWLGWRNRSLEGHGATDRRALAGLRADRCAG